MAGVNKVIILGRLGKDPELRTLDSGAKVCTMTLATSENFNDKEGNKQERTEWHNIVLWNKLAELANTYLSKGREVYLEGKLQTRSYDDANGVKKYTTEIVASNMNFIGGKSDGTGRSVPPPTEEPMTAVKETKSEVLGGNEEEDDLPF